MKRTFPTKNLISSEFQSFAIQKKSLKNQAYLRCQENLFCMIMISENSAVKKKDQMRRYPIILFVSNEFVECSKFLLILLPH